MKTILTVLAAFAMFLGHAVVTEAVSIDTRAKGPGLSCAPPNWFSARSDPLSRTNHYEFSGYCTQGAEGSGGNPITTVAAGRTVYTETSDWICDSQEAVERFSISTGKSRAKVVSYCPADPWINAVSCKSGAIQWIKQRDQGWTANHLDTSGLGGVFPLTSNHINRAALRKQLRRRNPGSIACILTFLRCVRNARIPATYTSSVCASISETANLPATGRRGAASSCRNPLSCMNLNTRSSGCPCRVDRSRLK